MAVLRGDARHLPLADGCVQCVVTSPPYWGLRDYGTAGQIGLEQTPDAYVAELVAVFREVRRVLRDDGVLWLNLGSSYNGAGYSNHANTGGARREDGGKQRHLYVSRDTDANQSRRDRRAPACGTDGTALRDWTGADSAYSGLCDGCLADFRTHRDRIAGSVRPNEQSEPLPSPTARDTAPTDCVAASPVASLPDAPASTTIESWRRHRGACSRCDSRASSLSGLRSYADDAPAFSRMTWLDYTGRLKQKDLVPTPWLVAMALQADGWYLRSDIIWHKPNPMPESVTDRPTKAHEMVFLLTKSDRYFYNAAAIAERVSETGVVASAGGQRQGFVLGQDGGLQDTSAPFAAICVRLASTVLDIAQSQNDVGLFALDAEVGQQVPDGSAGFPVVQVPVVRRAAAQAARFADGDISAKEFLQQMHSLCVALPDGDDLKEAWRLAMLHISHIDANGDRSVAVNDAGKVSEIKRIHTFDYTARVPLSEKAKAREQGAGYYRPNGIAGTRGVGSPTTTRNARTVWTIATQPYSGAHFATFPEALVERCVLAGSRARDLVFDPFGGSGTTARVALRLGRRAVCTELNPAYIALAQERTHVTLGLPLEVA